MCESSAGKCCSSSSCCAGRQNYPPFAAEALPVKGETRCQSNALLPGMGVIMYDMFSPSQSPITGSYFCHKENASV